MKVMGAIAAVSFCLALCITGSGNAAATSKPETMPGIITGLAQQCTGAPGEPKHPVQVILLRGSEVVVRRTKLGSHTYRFSEPPGRYKVTTNQSYVIPVKVTLRSGHVAHADLLSDCS
jgi:hypothetical protein